MFVPDLVVRGRRILTPRGMRPGTIHVGKGRILGILDPDAVPPGCPVDEAGEAVVLPGLVDPGVRVEEPVAAWPDALAAITRSAAAGGVTTVIAIPFDAARPASVPADVETARRSAEGRCQVDVGFWGRVAPGREDDLEALAGAGVLGFACTLGSPADQAPAMPEASLRAAMPVLARIGAPLVAHTHPRDGIAHAAAAGRRPGWTGLLHGARRSARRYAAYLESRPRSAENDAVALAIAMCREFQVRTHIAHLSSSDALAPVFHARSARMPFSAGTCPHYLYFAADEIPDGAVEFAASPPIRERANRELLWASLASGLLQTVASDHRPAPASRGSGRFPDARPGIASLQLGLSVVWTEARARGCSIDQVAAWMCGAPARLAGLARKGAIEAGYDADLVVLDPDAAFTVEAERSPGGPALTPYSGRSLRGVVQRTYVRGRLVWQDGKPSREPHGRFVLR